jgi:hypothetical protein
MTLVSSYRAVVILYASVGIFLARHQHRILRREVEVIRLFEIELVADPHQRLHLAHRVVAPPHQRLTLAQALHELLMGIRCRSEHKRPLDHHLVLLERRQLLLAELVRTASTTKISHVVVEPVAVRRLRDGHAVKRHEIFIAKNIQGLFRQSVEDRGTEVDLRILAIQNRHPGNQGLALICGRACSAGDGMAGVVGAGVRSPRTDGDGRAAPHNVPKIDLRLTYKRATYENRQRSPDAPQSAPILRLQGPADNIHPIAPTPLPALT